MTDFSTDKQFAKWDTICKKNGVEYIDFELIRVYRRFIDLDILSGQVHEKAKKAIVELDMISLASILNSNLKAFEQRLLEAIDAEQGQKLLKKVSRTISDNIQMKLSSLLEGVNE